MLRSTEVNDLNVVPDTIESTAGTRSPMVGLGVGLYGDYGAAQRIYVRRGYLPDGRGVMYNNQPVAPGSMMSIDDNATLMFTLDLS